MAYVPGEMIAAEQKGVSKERTQDGWTYWANLHYRIWFDGDANGSSFMVMQPHLSVDELYVAEFLEDERIYISHAGPFKKRNLRAAKAAYKLIESQEEPQQ